MEVVVDILLPLSIIPMFFVIGENDDAVGMAGLIITGIQMVFMLAPIITTERALKKNFDGNGNKRQ